MKIFRRRRFEAEMDAELRFHLDAYIEDLVRSGIDRASAERRARLEFGSIEANKEECRQAWGFQRLDELRGDVRLTWRMLRQDPRFAAVAILSLALGIGANTAIFGLIDAVMLRVLPVYQPEQLAFIEVVGSEGPNGAPPYPWFEAFRNESTSFEGLAAFRPADMELTVDGAREQVRGLWASSNFYSVLGVRPLLGRTLAEVDDEALGTSGGEGAVAVISRAYWRQRWNGDPAVVGRVVRLFDHHVTIVGVMPTETMSIEPGHPIDIAAPITLSDPSRLRDKGYWWFDVVGRLKQGAEVERARAETDVSFQAYMAELAMENPAAYSPTSPTRKMAFDHIELPSAARGTDRLRNQFSNPLLALLILAGMVLLAACVNVANLLLARATAREREFAVRLAIGAGRNRLIRQALTEAMVLVGIGSSLGIWFAVRGQSALAAFFAEGNDQIILDMSFSGRVLLVTLVISLLTGLAFGLLPGVRAARTNPAEGFQGSSRSVAGSRAGMRVGRGLIVLQIAVSAVLLSGAGLFVQSLRQLESVDLGFTSEGILTMEVEPGQQMHGTPEWLQLQSEVLMRVRHLPSVRSAAWSTMSPLSGRERGVALWVPAFTPEAPSDNNVHLVSVSPDYYATYGIPLLFGRTFTNRDHRGAPSVAILDETAALFYLGTKNAVGRRVGFRPGDPGYEIVGVVKDVRHQSIRQEPRRSIYLAIPQSIDPAERLALTVRGSGDASALAASIQSEIHASGSSLLITNVSTMEKQVRGTLMRERLVAMLSMAFGALALVLACIGLYGILAYAVARRTNEIGLRMALGASETAVRWLVFREALVLAAVGIGVGVPASLWLGQVTKTFLYGVEPMDIPTLAATTVVLLACAAIAGIAPACRASRLNPIAALRSE